jgi:hypothetical protein
LIVEFVGVHFFFFTFPPPFPFPVPGGRLMHFSTWHPEFFVKYRVVVGFRGSKSNLALGEDSEPPWRIQERAFRPILATKILGSLLSSGSQYCGPVRGTLLP